MSLWLLLADYSNGQGMTVPLIPGTVSEGPKEPNIDIDLNLEPSHDLYRSAWRGGRQAYELLWREEYVDCSVTARFRLDKTLIDGRPVQGHSADLLFALAVVTSVLRRAKGYPPLAATGALGVERGVDYRWVKSVESVSVKLRAALTVLPAGGLLFYPAADRAAVDAELHRAARAQGVELCPVERLDEAVARLGIAIEKIYLDAPYRGLKAFGYEHRTIFFGRETEIALLQECLLDREAKGRPGVLILGASGAGKSSLVQAGLIPALEKAGRPPLDTENADNGPPENDPLALDDRPIYWNVWRPRDCSKRSEAALLRSLQAGWSHLPELTGLRRAADFAEMAEAFAAAAPPDRRFVWVIDQLEELFTLRFPAALIGDFAEFLRQMQAQGVWLVATLRSDFYLPYQQQSTLLDVFGSGSHFDLLKPDAVALERIIEVPAEKAELRFETDAANRSLASQIREEMRAGGAEALPLLEYVLERLYEEHEEHEEHEEQKEQSGVLTFADYDAVGGLHGAIGKKADTLFEALDPDDQAILPKLLWDLTVPPSDAGPEQAAAIGFTARPVRLDAYPPDGPARRLIDAFTGQKARLLALDRADGGTVHVRVAHEALLNHWGYAKDILKELHNDMLVRDRVTESMQRWQKAQQDPSLLLPPGLPLSEGEDLLARRAAFLDSELVGYIDASSRTERERQRSERARLRRRFVMAVTAAVVLGVLSVVAWQQRQTAEQGRIELAETLARSDFIQGAQLMQEDKPRQALAYLARAIRMNGDENSADLASSIVASLTSSVAKVIVKHKKAIQFAAFSPDGQRVITASRDNTAQVWDVESGQPVSVPMVHQDEVRSAVFSPDGRKVVTASDDNTARVWDAETGQPVGPPMVHQGFVWSAAFSSDGKRVVTASLDNSAQVWDAETGQPVGPPMVHQGFVWSAVFSSDGERVVTASHDNTAQVWDVETGQPVGPPMVHQGFVLSALFSSDGRRVVTASQDSSAQVWNTETRQPVSAPIMHRGVIRSAAFSPNGHQVVTASWDKTSRVWDAESGQPVSAPMEHREIVVSAAFSPDGQRVVTASRDNTARVWHAETGQPISGPMEHREIVVSAAFSPNGRGVVTASWDKTARVWEVETGSPVSALMVHRVGVESATYSPNGRWVVTASDDDTAQVWEAETGRPVSAPMVHQSFVRSAAFSSDGRRVVTASWDKTARVWNAETGQPISAPMVHRKAVESAAFSPNGRWVVTASDDGTAQVWEAETGRPVSAPMVHQGFVRSAAFSPDGRRVATASWDNTARVWDTETGQPISAPMVHRVGVESAAFSPDGRWVVTASSDNTAQVWEAETGQPISALIRHQNIVYFAAFSPDGQRVVTASADKTARVWDAESGQPLSAPMVHRRSVQFVAFSPDGQCVVTASDDKTARVWDAETGQPLSAPMVHQGEVRSAEFSPDGRWVLTASGNNAQVWENVQIHDPGSTFSDFLEQTAGYRLNSAGALEVIPLKSKLALRAWLTHAHDLNPEARHFIEWLLSDPLERTVTPNGKQTVKQRVQQLIKMDTVESLNEALDYWPGHPMALGKLAAAMLRDTKPEQRDEILPTARLWSNLALRYAPNDKTVQDIANKVLQEIGSQ